MIKEIQGVPVITSEGTPYEIGYHHGNSAADRVKLSVELMIESCTRQSGLSVKQCRDLAMKYLPNVKKYNSNYVEELQGISEGAGINFEDIMLLNCRTELQKMKTGKGVDEACTAIAVMGDVSENGCTYIGQNWDNFYACKKTLIAHLIIQKNGKPSIFYVGEAGIISRMGMNSAGIGGCVTSLSSNGPVCQEGIPLQFVLRGVMDSPTLSEAIDAVVRMPNGAVNNLMIASKNGDVIDLELDHDNCQYVEPADGIMVHTNHYIHPNRPHYPYSCIYTGSSIVRKIRSEKILRKVKEEKGKINGQDIKAVFSDHGDYPYSICVHKGEEKELKQQEIQTVYSFLCDLEHLEMEIAIGNPCQSEYVKIAPFK